MCGMGICAVLQRSLFLQDIAIVEPRPREDAEPGTTADSEPRHCVLLRAGGQMSVLDMAQGLPPHVMTSMPSQSASTSKQALC